MLKYSVLALLLGVFWLPGRCAAQEAVLFEAGEQLARQVAVAAKPSLDATTGNEPISAQDAASNGEVATLLDPQFQPDVDQIPPQGWGFPYPIYVPPVFDPWIHVTGRLMWLDRTDGGSGQALIAATTPAATGTVLASDNLTFPTEAGVRGSILFATHWGWFVEMGYTGIFDQQASASVDLDPVTTGVTDMTQFFFGSATTSLTTFDATAVYESSLHTPELNLWLNETDWGFRPMIGVRWIQQSENFQLFETSNPGNGGAAELTNDLVGGQLGFQTVVWQRADWFRVQAICKAGAYQNRIDVTSAQNAAGVMIASFNREFTTTAFSGEINLTAIWQLTPHLNFHVGYTGLWLTDSGLVLDQNDNFDVFTGAGEIDTSTISYQGGHLGVTLSF